MSIKYACIFKYENYYPHLITEFPEENIYKLKRNMTTIFYTIPYKEYRKQTIEDEYENKYTYLTNDEYVIGCVTDKQCKYRIIENFIDDISNNLSKKEIPTDFLKNKIKYYNERNYDQIIHIQLEIDNAKNIVIDNIEKTLEKGEQLDNMQSNSNNLVNSSHQFDLHANYLKKDFFGKNAKMIFIIVIVLFIIISIIVLLTCGPTMNSCK